MSREALADFLTNSLLRPWGEGRKSRVTPETITDAILDAVERQAGPPLEGARLERAAEAAYEAYVATGAAVRTGDYKDLPETMKELARVQARAVYMALNEKSAPSPKARGAGCSGEGIAGGS